MPSSRSEPLAIPDVNVLLALVHPDHVHHQLAHAWFGGTTGFATTPVTEAGLVRLALDAKVVGQAAATPTAALASLRSLRADPRASFLADDASLAEPWIDLVGLSGHRQVTDLHLVDLAARHAAVLVTFDRALAAALVPDDRGHVRLIG